MNSFCGSQDLENKPLLTAQCYDILLSSRGDGVDLMGGSDFGFSSYFCSTTASSRGLG